MKILYKIHLRSVTGSLGSISGGIRYFNSYVMCPLCCFWRWPWHCAEHTFREAHRWVCLVFWFRVSCSLYRHLTHGHFGDNFQWMQVLYWRRISNRERKYITQKERRKNQSVDYDFCENQLWKLSRIITPKISGMFFWSVNFFRRTMHSKSPVVNLAERHETLLVNKLVAVCNSQLLLIFKKAVPIHLLIIHCFISLQLFSKYKWLYHFIITQVTFRHFFSVGIGNDLPRLCYNFNYPIQSTKLILSTFLRSEIQSVIEVMCLMLHRFDDLFC